MLPTYYHSYLFFLNIPKLEDSCIYPNGLIHKLLKSELFLTHSWLYTVMLSTFISEPLTPFYLQNKVITTKKNTIKNLLQLKNVTDRISLRITNSSNLINK